jgi:LysR family transcriptional regulator, glycine cleavage system transcriptional activator
VRYVGHFLVFPRLALRRQTLRVFMEWITKELKIDTLGSL